MKTTVDIADDLALRLKRMAQQTGRPMRVLIEEGLRRVLDAEEGETWTLPDRSVGDPDAPNPLETLTWQDLRDEIYGGR
jgi:hypothetical protein